MAYSDDETAGVLDLFGAMTRDELETALAELSFRRGADHTEEALSADVERAVETYHVIPIEGEPEVLVVGPAAFPELPEGADDLPHMLDVDRTAPSRKAAAEAAERQLRAEIARAVDQEEEAELARLLDVTYELEAWGPVEIEGLREQIDAVLE